MCKRIMLLTICIGSFLSIDGMYKAVPDSNISDDERSVHSCHSEDSSEFEQSDSYEIEKSSVELNDFVAVKKQLKKSQEQLEKYQEENAELNEQLRMKDEALRVRDEQLQRQQEIIEVEGASVELAAGAEDDKGKREVEPEEPWSGGDVPDTIRTLNEKLASKENDEKELKTKLNAAQGRISELESELARKDDELEMRDETIRSLEGKVENLEDEGSDMKALIKNNAKQIKELLEVVRQANYRSFDVEDAPRRSEGTNPELLGEGAEKRKRVSLLERFFRWLSGRPLVVRRNDVV